MSMMTSDPVTEEELEQARMHLPAIVRAGQVFKYPLDAYLNAGKRDQPVITREAVFTSKHFEGGEPGWVLLNPLRLF